jgi:MSHA pilin protein MshD
MKRRAYRVDRGVTLVELVVAITVIAIAGVALSSTLAYLSGTGNTSMLQAQAQSIANSYLNEIIGKNFVPNGVEANRAQFNDVRDYNGRVDVVARDKFNNAAGNFRVSVAVAASALNGVAAANVWLVNVTVNYGSGASVVATGYRTRYPLP